MPTLAVKGGPRPEGQRSPPLRVDLDGPVGATTTWAGWPAGSWWTGRSLSPRKPANLPPGGSLPDTGTKRTLRGFWGPDPRSSGLPHPLITDRVRAPKVSAHPVKLVRTQRSPAAGPRPEGPANTRPGPHAAITRKPRLGSARSDHPQGKHERPGERVATSPVGSAAALPRPCARSDGADPGVATAHPSCRQVWPGSPGACRAEAPQTSP